MFIRILKNLDSINGLNITKPIFDNPVYKKGI